MCEWVALRSLTLYSRFRQALSDATDSETFEFCSDGEDNGDDAGLGIADKDNFDNNFGIDFERKLGTGDSDEWPRYILAACCVGNVILGGEKQQASTFLSKDDFRLKDSSTGVFSVKSKASNSSRLAIAQKLKPLNYLPGPITNSRMMSSIVFFGITVLAAADVSRLMNNTNFRGHNLPNGGCNPDRISENFTTALKCQAACDALRACTVVPVCLVCLHKYEQKQEPIIVLMGSCDSLIVPNHDKIWLSCIDVLISPDVDICSQDVPSGFPSPVVLPKELYHWFGMSTTRSRRGRCKRCKGSGNIWCM